MPNIDEDKHNDLGGAYVKILTWTRKKDFHEVRKTLLIEITTTLCFGMEIAEFNGTKIKITFTRRTHFHVLRNTI